MKLTCYSAKHIGDKIASFEQEREYLLGKLVHKITRKMERHYPEYHVYGKGYSIEYGVEKIEWGSKWMNHPFSPKYHFIPSDIKDLPYVYFEFKYVNERFAYDCFRPFNRHYLKEYNISPEEVVPAIKEVAMISKTPLLYEDPVTYIRGNCKMFKIIIPLSYYSYDERFINRYQNGRHV